MPTNTTLSQTIWPGGQVTTTYNGQGRLSEATLFVPNNYTGVIAITTGGQHLPVEYVAPVDGHSEVTPTDGGVEETFNGKLGMRWTRTFSPAVNMETTNTSWAVGCSRTAV